MTIERYGVTQRYADAVLHNGTVYLVEVPTTDGADIATQTRETLHSIEQQLEQRNSGKNRLLMVQIFLRDMADYAAMNEVWDAWLPSGCAPARACLQASLANPHWRIEIIVTAAINEI